MNAARISVFTKRGCIRPFDNKYIKFFDTRSLHVFDSFIIYFSRPTFFFVAIVKIKIISRIERSAL